MRHYTSPKFWEFYKKLPGTIQKLSVKSFDLLKNDPYHPSLHLKKVNHFWSVRIGLNYRALAVEKDRNLIWFWIGKHSEYDKII